MERYWRDHPVIAEESWSYDGVKDQLTHGRVRGEDRAGGCIREAGNSAGYRGRRLDAPLPGWKQFGSLQSDTLRVCDNPYCP